MVDITETMVDITVAQNVLTLSKHASRVIKPPPHGRSFQKIQVLIPYGSMRKYNLVLNPYGSMPHYQSVTPYGSMRRYHSVFQYYS